MKGLDLEKSIRTERFTFVDGLDGLFLNQNQQCDRGQRALRNADMRSVEMEVLSAIEETSVDLGKGGEKRSVLLVVDGIDLFMASTGATAQELVDVIGEWREVRWFTSSFNLMLLRQSSATSFLREPLALMLTDP
jgi:elongator complex protein 6